MRNLQTIKVKKQINKILTIRLRSKKMKDQMKKFKIQLLIKVMNKFLNNPENRMKIK